MGRARSSFRYLTVFLVATVTFEAGFVAPPSTRGAERPGAGDEVMDEAAAPIRPVPEQPAALDNHSGSAETTTRISESSQRGQGNGISEDAYISADGRFIVFHSVASNLVVDDTNGFQDIFLRDVVAETTTRVSVATDGTQANEASWDPAISGDGRYVVFRSLASNLAGGDTNAKYDIFVWDRVSRATTRLSINSSGGQGNGHSGDPIVSYEGRYITFRSASSNLVSGDTNGVKDVFVHDRTTAATSRVSVSSSGGEGNGDSDDPAISDDGRYVAFWSLATNLVSGDTNTAQDIFVHDRSTGATTRVSIDSSGVEGNGLSDNPSISGDGRYVAFDSAASNLVAGDTNAFQDVFVHDRTTAATTRVSISSSGGQGNKSSDAPSISDDGRWVAFASHAEGLVASDTNNRRDIFLRDRTTGSTYRKSVGADGRQANDHSDNPELAAADGLSVAFQSDAANLVYGDTNLVRDVFVRHPSDFADRANFGRQRQHTFESWDLGAGDELAVNVFNRNLVLAHPLVTLPIRGSSLPVSLAYNSQDSTNLGLGPGWRLNLQRRLTLHADGRVTFADADGGRYTFTAPLTSGTATSYTRPAGLYATLVKDTAQAVEFTLTYKDQSRDTFDIVGVEALLVRSEDRFANGVTLAYGTGANVSSVTDDTNRQLLFAWDTGVAPNRLISFTDWAYINADGVVQTTNAGSRRSYRFFFDPSGLLAGWSDPLNVSTSCPAGGSHLTCLAYTGGLLTTISKTQTYETFSAGSLGTATRTITSAVAYSSHRVSTVTDAEQHAQQSPARTTFSADTGTQVTVVRPGTPASTNIYGLVSRSDLYGRATSIWRRLGTSDIERRTVWDSVFPTEPGSVTENHGAILGTPARTVGYSYVSGSLGNLSRLSEPLTAATNRWTDYVYNANNDVTQMTVSQDGSTTLRMVTRYCYAPDCSTSGNGLTLLKVLENYVEGGAANNDTNVAAEYAYDAYGQRTRETRHNRDAAGNVRDDRVAGFTHDGSGNLTAEILNYVDGQVTGGADTDPDATTGARTDLTAAHTYDTAGNRVSTADPRRAIFAATQTPANDDYVTRWTYDALNRRLTERAPTTPSVTAGQKTARSAYDELGAAREVSDFGGLTTASEYDRTGRVTRVFERAADAGAVASITSETTYDAAGRVTAARDRNQLSDASLGSTTYAYDALGRQTLLTQAAGTTAPADTTTVYDALDRRSSLEVGAGSPSSVRTTYGYDLGGRVTSTDDAFSCTTEAFDYRGNAVSTTSGLAGNGCGPGANQRAVSHTYDGAGRLVTSEITAGVGTGDRTLSDAFDAAGNRLSASTRTAGMVKTTTFNVNLLDEVQMEERPDGSTSKTNYDARGNATDRCYWAPGATVGSCHPAGTTPWPNSPTQVTSTSHDALNQRIRLVNGATNATSTYDPAHNYQLSAIYVPTAAGREQQTLYTYDSRHRVSGITFQNCPVDASHACTGTPVTSGSDSYSYDNNNNRTRVHESNGALTSDRRYCYDALNQLVYSNTGADCSGSSFDERYSYDDAGNRTEAASGGITTTYAYDAEGRLCMVGGGSCDTPNVSHDSAGRISNWNSWHFGYDPQGRVVSACRSSTCASGFDKISFAYDGEGHRTKIETTSADGVVTTTEFRYHGEAIVEEKTNGTVTRQYVVDEAGSVVKVIIPDGIANAGTFLVHWNGHGDALNMVRLNADGTTTLANSFTYGTWGEPTTASHNGISDLGFRFLYLGRFGVQWDNQFGVALEYMRARHYVPALGRFLQPDPSRQESNAAAYSSSNPVSKADPDGKCAVWIAWVPYVGPAAAAATCGYALIILGAGFLAGAAGVAVGWFASSVTVTENAAHGRSAEARALERVARPGRYYATHVGFATPWGARFLDICEYHSVWHYLLWRWRPIQCWEVKSGGALYWGTLQHKKDMWLMARYGFRVHLIRMPGRMEWP